MNRKHIDITGSNKTQNWIKTVPAKAFNFINANGVTFAAVQRNYYLDSKTGKIRYQSTNCDNASYNHLYYVYIEFYPGIFAFCGTATDGDNSMTQRIETALNKFSQLSEESINHFRESLIRH